MTEYLLIAYLVTGFVAGFDIYAYNVLYKGKHYGLFTTGVNLLITTLFWLPCVILDIYVYWLTTVWYLLVKKE